MTDSTSSCQMLARVPDQVGESPVWCARSQTLYWVDIDGRQIHRCAPVPGAVVHAWTLPERVGCLALLDDGRVLAAMETRIAVATLGEPGELSLQTLATIDHPAPGMRCNDGRCDPVGRLWVGTMVMDGSLASAQGGLYCLDERGLTGPHVTGLITPNGLGFSPDGRTMYLSDSHASVQTIWAFDYDVATGALSNRRVFVDMKPLPGRPDGAAVDAQGYYWICGNDAGEVHVFSPQGVWMRSVSVPVPKPAMCAFGGAHLDTLFVTSIVPADPAMDASGLSGAVFMLQPGATGRAEPCFSRFPQVA